MARTVVATCPSCDEDIHQDDLDRYREEHEDTDEDEDVPCTVKGCDTGNCCKDPYCRGCHVGVSPPPLDDPF